jgi:F-type H+-transporting ATPase subunit epsilon
MVVAPTAEGEIGILPLHAPLVSVLRAGEVRLKWDNEKSVEWFAISGGYIQVHEDKVIILADEAVSASRIDVERARHAKDLARARIEELRSLPIDERGGLAECEADLRWCEVQLKVAERTK